MPVKKKSFWLCYDFGLRGNYAGLFAFLDNHDAIECGNGVAYFQYSNVDQLETGPIIDKLKGELSELIGPTQSDRVYIIYKDELKVSGKFLFGARKAAPWSGYGNKKLQKGTDEAV